jgi:hypothetical protein
MIRLDSFFFKKNTDLRYIEVLVLEDNLITINPRQRINGFLIPVVRHFSVMNFLPDSNPFCELHSGVDL